MASSTTDQFFNGGVCSENSHPHVFLAQLKEAQQVTETKLQLKRLVAYIAVY